MSAPARLSPVLDGALRDEAESRVREIARELERPWNEWTLSRRPDGTGLRDVSLALGRCGSAVFHAWLGRTGRDAAASDRAVGLLEEAIDLLPERDLDASLLCGFPGVAWTTEHVLALLGDEPEEDPNEGIDEALLGGLRDPSYVPAYDLIDGLAGHGVYALERRHRPTGPALMSAVLERLENTAVPQRTGLAWPSGQQTRTAQGRDVAPDETYFNLGMSHGIPGVVGILARFAAVEELRPRALPLLEGVAAWIREQRLPPGAEGAYPDFVAEGVRSEPARVAWCYGDPGVAAALWSASVALEDERLGELALDVAHAAARRDFATTQVVDAGLCHGSAGVAHVFHRLYRATGDEECGHAARAWLGRLLERVDDRPNVAGFATFCFERVREGEYIEDPAWLTGAVGVGLVLLSALSEGGLPAWDRPLLLDLAP